MTAPAATERALQLARAGYGAALVLAPGPAILLATGRLPGRRACRVARLLGARHLAQATLTALTPLPAVFGAGAEVDALHAASMLMLAAVDRAARRAALTDTVAEAAFAAAGLAAAASRRGGTGRQSCRCSAHPRRSRGDGAVDPLPAKMAGLDLGAAGEPVGENGGSWVRP